MRLWLYGLATVIAGISALLLAITPAPSQKTQARTGSAAQLTAMLQGSGLDVQCHNNRTFCRADVSRCDSNERERQNWRTQCLAPHKKRYEDCLARRDGRAPGRLPHGRILTPQEECKHLASYASTRCQVEPQICPTYRQCEQQFGQCVQDMGATLRDRQNDRVDGAYVPEPQPARTTRPIPRPTSQPARINMTRAAKSMAKTQAKQRAKAETRDLALRYAQLGNMAGLERLLDEGMAPGFSNKDGNTLLHAAASAPAYIRDGNIAMLERLIALGVDVDRRNQAREIPLSLALDQRIKYKSYQASDRTAPTTPYKNDVLHTLVDAAKILPKEGGEGGLTLLHVAALDYDALMIQKLLRRSFPIDVKDDRGRTAYDIAARKSPALAALFPQHAVTGGEAGKAAVKRAAECSDLSLVPEDQWPRYRALAERGVLIICAAE